MQPADHTGTGIAAKVLKSMGVNLKDARVEVEKVGLIIRNAR